MGLALLLVRLMLAEITSGEWLAVASILAGLAVPCTAGWVAVYVKLAVMHADLRNTRSQLRGLKRARRADRADQRRQWEHISQHEGRLDTLERAGGRVLDKLQLPPLDAGPAG